MLTFIKYHSYAVANRVVRLVILDKGNSSISISDVLANIKLLTSFNWEQK